MRDYLTLDDQPLSDKDHLWSWEVRRVLLLFCLAPKDHWDRRRIPLN